MADSHSEDSPLLGEGDSFSPGPVGMSPSWEHSWGQENSMPSGTTTPKMVPSQTSMDSGCDCDPSEGEGRSPPSKGKFSPLPPSQPHDGPSEPSSPGPSGLVAPLAQKESPDCHCGAVSQRCVCDAPPETSFHGDGTPSVKHPLKGDLQCSESSSTTCKVTFRIEGYDDVGDEACWSSGGRQVSAMECMCSGVPEPGDDFTDLVRSAVRTFPRVTSYSKTGMISASSSTASMPMCRICHFPQGEGVDMLISPCRCAGTMQFIHESCLMKWLEISSKRKKPATCELCYYQFHRHKKFRFSKWKSPSCSQLDKILHSVFLLCLLVMVTCAAVTVYCFKQDRFVKKRDDADLTKSEIVTLTCGIMFFVAFFLAMYVEVKAKDTLYRLFSKFLYLNQTWHIDEYDKRKDTLQAPV